MKFVLLTYDGHGLPIAYKLLKEGYDVLVGQIENLEFMPKEEEEIKRRRLKLYEGMLEKINADKLIEILSKETNKKDYFIISDFNYVYPYAEKLTKMGFSGLLPKKEDYELENNRQKAKELVMRNYDIFAHEETFEFDNIDDAKEFLKERTDKIWGIKGFNPEAPTFFSDSDIFKIANEELIDIMENNKQIYESQGFILEEKIEDLIEFVPEIITFDNEILGINVCIELKKYGSKNTAFQTGCSADMIFWVDKKHWEKIIKYFFPVDKLYMRKNEMVVWDAGVMYSPSRGRFYFSEFCSSRFGYNAIFSELSTFLSVGNYFEKIIKKQSLFDNDVFQFGCSVRLFNENRENKKEFKHLIMSNCLVIVDDNDKNIWLWDVYKKNNKIYTVGYDHNLLVVTYGSDDWVKNFYLIEEKISKSNSLFFSTGYYRTSDDILGTNYKGNITERFNLVNNYFLLEIERDDMGIKTMEKLERVINKLNEITVNKRKMERNLSEKEEIINQLNNLIEKFLN